MHKLLAAAPFETWAADHAINDDMFEIDNVDEIRIKAGVTIDASGGPRHDLIIKTTDQTGASLTNDVEIDVWVSGKTLMWQRHDWDGQ